MSDDGQDTGGDIETEVNDNGEGSFEGGGGGDSDGGPVNPCCAWAIGLVCLVISIMGLYKNEGNYVQQMETIERVKGHLVMACNKDCSACDFSKVTEYDDDDTAGGSWSGSTRAMADGDLVWLGGCDILGMKSAQEALAADLGAKSGFLKDIAPALKSEPTAAKGAKFSWKYEMIQPYWEPFSKQFTFDAGTMSDSQKQAAKTYCTGSTFTKATFAANNDRCDFTFAKRSPATPTPPPTPKPPTPAPTPVPPGATPRPTPAPVTPAPTPVPPVGPEVTCAEACASSGPSTTRLDCCCSYCATNAAGVAVCTWSSNKCHACDFCPKTAAFVATAFNSSAAEFEAEHMADTSGDIRPTVFESEEDAEDNEDEDDNEERTSMSRRLGQNERRLASPRRRRSQPRRRRTISVTCTVPECKKKEDWRNTIQVSPNSWTRLPANGGTINYVPLPKNLPSLSSQKYSIVQDGLQVGTAAAGAFELKLSGSGEDATFEDHIFPKMEGVSLTPKITSTTDLELGTLVEPSMTYDAYDPISGSARGVKVTVNSYNRDNVVWDDTKSMVGSSHCTAGCICSSSDSVPDPPHVGDVRVCLQQSSTKSVTIISGVKKVGDKWQLTPDEKLQTKDGSMGTLAEGSPFYVFPNTNKDAVTIFKDQTESVAGITNALRVILPLLMWFAMYCCLTPIVWVIDKAGDSLDGIPCVGDMLGGIAECIETLATCVICMVSCCGALGCSLFVMAFAWLVFRPLYGIGMLIASFCLCGGLAYFATTRKGEPKVRGRPSARTPPLAAPQTQMQEVQPQTQMQVQCPAGCGAGSPIQIQAPSGQMVTVTVPDGVEEGQMFMVNV